MKSLVEIEISCSEKDMKNYLLAIAIQLKAIAKNDSKIKINFNPDLKSQITFGSLFK